MTSPIQPSTTAPATNNSDRISALEERIGECQDQVEAGTLDASGELDCVTQAVKDYAKPPQGENKTRVLLKTLHEKTKWHPYFDINHMAGSADLNPLVTENPFRTRAPEQVELPTFEAAKAKLPQPRWEGHDDAIACYWKAWELAFKNLNQPNENNGFVSNYIDPAFNNDIFMWDTAFMLQFGRYGSRAFDFQGSLDNFYAHQHNDGFISRQISQIDGSEMFASFDPSSTGPNVFPWVEWEYYENFGDKDRLAEVFPGLLAYWKWLDKYRTWPNGTYFSTGWGCGMDNQPRQKDEPIPELNHGHMEWIDTTMQEIFAAKVLIRMAKRTGPRPRRHRSRSPRSGAHHVRE